jgi:glycerol uptake facilitator-like aquaporin
MVTATAISVDVLYYTGHEVDYVSRWLARGFVAAAVIYAFGEISGAHADPAVTFGFALSLSPDRRRRVRKHLDLRRRTASRQRAGVRSARLDLRAAD